jgi:peptidoglycan/xylan/chitin deacetylase (PgdA/CDA1 family)
VGPRRRDPFLVLIYHRVNLETNPFAIERTPTGAFRAQMRHLARSFHVMPLAEIVERMRTGEPLPPRTIAITFDDGYEDNYTEAFPILRELRLPATIFLTTGCIGTGESLWFDRVLHAFATTERDSVTLSWGAEMTGLRDTATRAQAAFQTLYGLMRLPNTERIEAIEGLVRDLDGGGESVPLPPMLNWDHVRTMAAGGITFGAHTVTHPILTRLPLEEAKQEIETSKRRIEDETGRPVGLFAYPVGRRADYSPEVIELIAGAGFHAALTTAAGANVRGNDLFLLRRVKPLGEDVPSFALGLGAHYLTEWKAANP